MPNWFNKNKNQAIASKPSGKTRLSLSQIMTTGGNQLISDISNQLWFPAGQPIPNVAPKGTPPRRYAYEPLANINWSGRDGAADFRVLREFSYHPITRAVIETVKDRCTGVNWDFTLVGQAGETKKALKERTATDPRIQQLKDFFKKPDGWQNFRSWSRGLYDDMLVIDAASLWMVQDEDSHVYACSQIDGALVFPLIDETGQQPAAQSANKARRPGELFKDFRDRRKTVPVAVKQTSDKKASKKYLDLKKKADAQGGSPAFQLTPYGYPAQELTADELGYYVRNRLTYRRYGFSIVEQCLAYIALSLGRLEFQAAFYRSGNVPEYIAFAPSDVPTQKVEQFQGYLDSILQGNLQNRRKGFIFPGMGSEGKPSIIFPKINEQILKDEFDEWLARVICYFFGLPPTAFIKSVNRATAEQAAESGEEEGLQPYIDWFGDLLNDIIQDRFGWTDIQATPQIRLEQNAKTQSDINKSDFESGLATLNEVRERMGLDPISADWANANIVITGSGPIRLDGEPISQQQAQALTAFANTLEDGGPKPPKGHPPKGNPPAEGEEAPDQSEKPPAKKAANFVSVDELTKGKKLDKAVVLYMPPKVLGSNVGAHCGDCWKFVGGEAKPKGSCVEVDGDISAPHGVCGLYVNGRVFDGVKPTFNGPEKVSKAVAGYVEQAPTHCGNCDERIMKDDLNTGTCKKVEGDIERFACCNRWEEEKDKAEKVQKKVTNPKDTDPGDSRHKWPFSSPEKLAPISLKARNSIQETLKACFGKSKKHFEQAIDKYERSEKVSKSDPAEDLFNQVWEIIGPEFGSLPSLIQSHLEDAARAGVEQAVEQLSAQDTGLIQSANEQAAKWTANRAAELVGKRFEGGQLVDNPDAKWVISDTTRDEIRDAIKSAFERETDLAAVKARIKFAPGVENTFSDARADMIAKTEVGRAQMGSTFDFWKSSGLVKSLQWFTAGNDPCDECAMNADAVVEFGQAFPSGAFSTLDSHPSCNCGVFAVMQNSQLPGSLI